MSIDGHIAWHELEAAEAAAQLECDPAVGLSGSEVQSRLEAYGPNRMAAQQRISELMRFLLQFNQPLIYILLGAAAVTAGLQEWVDASVIFAVVLVNAVVGYLQEAKAEKAIDALADMVVTEATVRRDGKKRRISSADLVPGDVVLVQSGDRVPAEVLNDPQHRQDHFAFAVPDHGQVGPMPPLCRTAVIAVDVPR